MTCVSEDRKVRGAAPLQRAGAPEGRAAGGRNERIHQALRGRTFDEQVQMLAPEADAPPPGGPADAAPGPAIPNPEAVCSLGDSGDEVVEVKRLLSGLGFEVDVTKPDFDEPLAQALDAFAAAYHVRMPHGMVVEFSLKLMRKLVTEVAPAESAVEGAVPGAQDATDSEKVLAAFAKSEPEQALWRDAKPILDQLARVLLGEGLSPGPDYAVDDTSLVNQLQLELGLTMTGHVSVAMLDAARARLAREGGATPAGTPADQVDLPDPEAQGIDDRDQPVDLTPDQLAITRKERASGDLFVAGISASDVAQGGMGDCYFLAALSSLAQQEPSAIEAMFPGGMRNPAKGTYGVRFFRDNGPEGMAPVVITVDADLYQRGAVDLYAKTSAGNGQRELWVALAEKAYVQFVSRYGRGGSEDKGEPGATKYGAISGGVSAIAMAQITGRSTEIESVDAKTDPRMLYRRIREALDASGSAAAGTNPRARQPVPPEVPAFLQGKINLAPREDDDAEATLASRAEAYRAARVLPALETISTISLGSVPAAERDAFDGFLLGLQKLDAELTTYIADVSNGSADAQKRHSIIASHAYSILGAFQQGDRYYVKLRNPHASNEPKGGGADDGAFVLAIEDFIETYGHVDVVGRE